MTNSKNKELIGKLLLLSVTIIWGSSFIVLKNTLDELGGGYFTFFILFFRFGTATIFMSLIGIKKFKLISRATVKKGLLLGAILFAAYAVQTLGLKYTTSSKNAFLTAGYCVVVPFLSWMYFKKRPKLSNFAAAVICLVGIAFVALIGRKEQKGENELLGDLLTLGCCLFYALQIIYNAKYAENEDPVAIIIIELATVSALSLIVSCVSEFPFHAESFSLDGISVLKILYLAVFATCYAQFGQFYGQKFTKPTSASLILTLEAVFGVLFGVFAGNEKLTVWIIIGFVIIFIAETISETGFGKLDDKFDEMIGKNKIRNHS